MIALNKDQWLSQMPELIYNLKSKYNFYFSGWYATINKDILEIIKNPKHKHKIAVYCKDKRFFLVVYRKDHQIFTIQLNTRMIPNKIE